MEAIKLLVLSLCLISIELVKVSQQQLSSSTSIGNEPSSSESSFIVSHSSLDQQSFDANSFVTAYPKNGQFAALSTIRLHITTTEDSPVSFNVSNPSMTQYTGTVSPGQSVSVPIPYALTVTSINDQHKAIYIKAEGNKTVRVYSSNYVATSAGAFSVLPLHQYDTIDTYTYYVISTGTQINNRYSTVVLVSGMQASTNVTIVPTRPVTLPSSVTGLSEDIVVQANEKFEFTMSSLQTVLLQNLQDITGTKIQSTQPLAVIASHQCGMVPTEVQYCDHVVHQIAPTNTWGSNYMSLHFPSGTVYKMIAAVNNTSVIVTCGREGSTSNADSIINNVTYLGPLQSGESVQYSVHSNSTWCSIVSDGPLLVIQLAKGGEQRQVGDPMSLVLTPIEQYTNVSTLVIPPSLYQTNLDQIIDINAQIFVRASENISRIEMTLDGQPITGWTPVYSGNNNVLTGYATKVTRLSNNAHTISSSTPLYMGISIFGYSNNDAYSYPLNGGLKSLSKSNSLPVEIEFDQTNYTLIEGENHFLPVTRRNGLNHELTLTARGCNGSSLPSNIVMSQRSIQFASGDQTKIFQLYVEDDSELSQEECFCIELVQPGQFYTFLRPYSKATACIRDNEDVRVQISSAVVSDDSKQLDLTLSLTGYQGSEDMRIVIQPMIVSDQEQEQVPSLSLINVYFTKYLTTSTYTLTLTSPLPSDALLVIDTMDTRLNITTDPVDITFPPSLTTPTTSSSIVTTTITITTPTPEIISSTSVPHLTSSSSSSPLFTPIVTASPPPTDSLGFMSNYSNIILPVFGIIVLVLLIISLAFCTATVYLIKRRKATSSIDFKTSELRLTEEMAASITSSQLSIPKQLPASHSFSSSESQDPHHVRIHHSTINTNSPNHYTNSSPPHENSNKQYNSSSV